MSALETLGTGHDNTTRRRGAHTMERIERLDESLWRVYAGDFGHDLGIFRTKSEAKDALDTWHYFHPEEQRERDKAWVREFIQSMRTAIGEGMADEWLDRLAKRWELA